MHRGSLKDVMCDPNYKISWKRVFRFCKQMTQGLQHLHNWTPCVVHRDIKSANMLVNNENIVKICDLGLARFVDTNQITMFQARGSMAYMVKKKNALKILLNLFFFLKKIRLLKSGKEKVLQLNLIFIP